MTSPTGHARAVAALSSTEALLCAYFLLDGEDDYTMGDPGPLGATAEARTALLRELAAVGLDPDDGSVESFRHDSNDWVEAEYDRLAALDRQISEARWREALAEVAGADEPLTSLAPDAAQAVVAKAASILNDLGHRRSALHDVARNLVLIVLLDQSEEACNEEVHALDLQKYAKQLALVNQRVVLWNGLEIGVDTGPYYEYVGELERYSDTKILAEDFEATSLPHETARADWRLIS